MNKKKGVVCLMIGYEFKETIFKLLLIIIYYFLIFMIIDLLIKI